MPPVFQAGRSVDCYVTQVWQYNLWHWLECHSVVGTAVKVAAFDTVPSLGRACCLGASQRPIAGPLSAGFKLSSSPEGAYIAAGKKLSELALGTP